MEFPSFESIRLPSWVLVSSIFMGILFLMIAFNFLILLILHIQYQQYKLYLEIEEMDVLLLPLNFIFFIIII